MGGQSLQSKLKRAAKRKKETTWECLACTLQNPIQNRRCQVCESRRPPPAAAATPSLAKASDGKTGEESSPLVHKKRKVSSKKSPDFSRQREKASTSSGTITTKSNLTTSRCNALPEPSPDDNTSNAKASFTSEDPNSNVMLCRATEHEKGDKSQKPLLAVTKLLPDQGRTSETPESGAFSTQSTDANNTGIDNPTATDESASLLADLRRQLQEKETYIQQQSQKIQRMEKEHQSFWTQLQSFQSQQHKRWEQLEAFSHSLMQQAQQFQQSLLDMRKTDMDGGNITTQSMAGVFTTPRCLPDELHEESTTGTEDATPLQRSHSMNRANSAAATAPLTTNNEEESTASSCETPPSQQSTQSFSFNHIEFGNPNSTKIPHASPTRKKTPPHFSRSASTAPSPLQRGHLAGSNQEHVPVDETCLDNSDNAGTSMQPPRRVTINANSLKKSPSKPLQSTTNRHSTGSMPNTSAYTNIDASPMLSQNGEDDKSESQQGWISTYKSHQFYQDAFGNTNHNNKSSTNLLPRQKFVNDNDDMMLENSQSKYPCQEVIRKKKDREGLPCYDCEMCRRAIAELRRTGHEVVTGNNENASSRKQSKTSNDPLRYSRHRARHPPPETPPGFWDIGFADERESQRDAKF